MTHLAAYAVEQHALSTSPVQAGTVLLLSLVSEGFGGLEAHVLNLALQSRAAGRSVVLLVRKGSVLQRRAAEQGLPCLALGWLRWVRGTRIRNFLLTGTLTRICRRLDIRVLHCNNRFEISSAVRAARKLSAKCLLNYHVPDPFDISVLEGVDAFVSPSRQAVDFVADRVKGNAFPPERIHVLPPVVDATKFLSFSDGRSRAEWFSQELGITDVHDQPVVCMVGNMVSDLEHKNYPLLFRSLAILIHERRFPVVAMLVGDGPAEVHLRSLAKKLGVDDFVHFLGHRTDDVPGIIYMSNVLVLASSHEAFGMVLVEAALVGRPTIAARGTGAEQIVLHRETGLLFENGNASSLADAMEVLLTQPQLASALGSNAKRSALIRFSPESVARRYFELYDSGRADGKRR